jgi:hypothetical protein
MTCPSCPCPDVCLQWPDFCEWAKHKDESRYAHICNRSRIGTDRAKYPPIVQQARNLFRSALGLARSGFRLAPKSIRRERLEICHGCEHYDLAQERCRVCGCANSVKAWVASDGCPLPIPKWGPVIAAVPPPTLPPDPAPRTS